MPRRSAADISVRPPADLAADSPERKLFVDFVVSVPANHFRDCEAPFLAAYCRAVRLEQIASSELAACGFVIDGRPSGWLNILG